MKPRFPALSILAAVPALTACIVPPSAFERASYGPPQEYWQKQGRYRQAPDPDAPAENGTARPAPSGPRSVSTDPALEALESGGKPPACPPTEPPLYAWDGGIVNGAPQGAVTEQEGAPRGLETPPAGRMHIIELYQQVLDERDALTQEVELLRKNLEQTTQALEAKTNEGLELATRVAALESNQKALMEDNHSLSTRLVTAQIRRLEAEKLLLETRIEIERAKAEEANQAAQAQARANGNRSGKAQAPRSSGADDGGNK